MFASRPRRRGGQEPCILLHAASRDAATASLLSNGIVYDLLRRERGSCRRLRITMCGILAVMSFDGQPMAKEPLRRMRDAMVHRGPDDAGLYLDGSIALGHRRLSVIDLSPDGHQPMPNEDQTVWLVFNGEIYNYVELRAELLQRGHRFRSKTDSEVIIHLYEELGARCVDRLNGMFAFAIWDARKRLLFGARDRLGIKPFY